VRSKIFYWLGGPPNLGVYGGRNICEVRKDRMFGTFGRAGKAEEWALSSRG
jgi:hypothetical protein